MHSCVKTTLLPNAANVRIVDANTNCNSNETALDWDKNAASSSANFGLPFFCNGCKLVKYADSFAGKDFSEAQIQASSFFDFEGETPVTADLTGVIFKDAILNAVGFTFSNLTEANFSSTKGDQNSFNETNLTNADFSNSELYRSNFTYANLQNADFTNANVQRANFTGAINMDTATLTAVTWDNPEDPGSFATCPDGTNSIDNGHTCIGHLTP